ncbi:MAG: prephenate dehydratase domain-containing protein [Rikenellaceae bacterium]
MKQVTIQGVSGCFHEEAARKYFADEEIETVECKSFNDLFKRMAADRTLLGAIAIENTIAGSLLQNHELLQNSDLRIVGEHKIRISHNVAVLPEETIADITEVNSHPIALMQCRVWLDAHPTAKVVETGDTAGSAKAIADGKLTGHAAICGEYAAGLYGLKIIERGIETNKRNFTRFLILADKSVAESMVDPQKINKASLSFTTPHSSGSLSKVLTILSFYGINLSKIQSLPIIGREWEYQFYVDVIFDDRVRFRQSIDAIRPLTNELKILGEYTQCQNPE